MSLLQISGRPIRSSSPCFGKKHPHDGRSRLLSVSSFGYWSYCLRWSRTLTMEPAYLSTYVIYVLSICWSPSAWLPPPSDGPSPICHWRSPLVKPDLVALCFNAGIAFPRLTSVGTSARLPLAWSASACWLHWTCTNVSCCYPCR
jgi:hypothetical protein